MSLSRYSRNQSSRLEAVPTDIRYSIFLNTPPDALDDVCQNDIFFEWCHDYNFMREYTLKWGPSLLQEPDGFLKAAEAGSVVWSEFLTDFYLNSPPIGLSLDLPRSSREFIGVNFAEPPIINFCLNANFGNLTNSDIPLNDILTIVTRYGIINRMIFSALFIIYTVNNRLIASGHDDRFIPDQFLLDTFTDSIIDPIINTLTPSVGYHKLLHIFRSNCVPRRQWNPRQERLAEDVRILVYLVKLTTYLNSIKETIEEVNGVDIPVI